MAAYCIATEIDDENFVEIQPVDPSGQRRKKKGERISWRGFRKLLRVRSRKDAHVCEYSAGDNRHERDD